MRVFIFCCCISHEREPTSLLECLAPSDLVSTSNAQASPLVSQKSVDLPCFVLLPRRKRPMQRCLAPSLRFITTKVASKPAVPLPKAAAATRKVYKVKAGDLLAAQYKRTLAPYSLPSHLPKPRLTNSTPAVDAFVQKVQASSVPFTAFDMEWNMSTQRGVERRTALIQIAHPQLGMFVRPLPSS